MKTKSLRVPIPLPTTPLPHSRAPIGTAPLAVGGRFCGVKAALRLNSYGLDLPLSFEL